MTLIVVGRSDEVTGFALAGVKTMACDSPDGVRATVDAAVAADRVGLVLLSPWIAQHAAVAVAAARRRKGPPVVTVMPG